jgi:hypothetical protein
MLHNGASTIPYAIKKRGKSYMSRVLSLLLVLFSLTACAGLRTIQGPVSQFSQSTEVAVAAEKTFLDSVNALYARANEDKQREEYLKNPASLKELKQLDVADPAISENELSVFQSLLDGLKLYGQKLAALATNDTNKQLDENSQKLATTLLSFNKDALSHLTKPPPEQDIAVGITGLNELAKLVLDNILYKDIKNAANSMRKNLENVVKLLKELNTNYSVLDEQSKKKVTTRLLLTLRESNPPTILVYNQLRDEYRQINAVGVGVKTLNSALDAMTEANKAIASSSEGGIAAAVQNYVQKAVDAYQFYQRIGAK